MMNDLAMYRSEGQIALLNLFAATIGMPIVLYEFEDDQVEIFRSDAWVAGPEPYCRFIQELTGTADFCKTDECVRAETIANVGEKELKTCWAGLHNQLIPVHRTDGKAAVIVYGEMLVEGDVYRQESLDKLQRIVKDFGLDDQQATKAKQLLLAAKRHSLDYLQKLNSALPKAQRWYYTLRRQMDNHIEDVAHELATSLQGIMSNAQVLGRRAGSLDSRHVRHMSKHLLTRAQELDRVVQNLSQSYTEYRFEELPLADILATSKSIYQDEADERSVTLHIVLHRVDGELPVLQISRPHIQSAVNNLLHNAIKYSFSGNAFRERYVKVEGAPAGHHYALVFENYGVGILQQEIDSGAIWHRGYQGKLTYGEFRAGAGRGLYSTKKIIERHRGHIQVESHQMSNEDDPFGEPHLTTFTVYLPYEQPTSEEVTHHDEIDRVDRRGPR